MSCCSQDHTYVQAPPHGAQWGTLTTAVRLCEQASIGNGFWKTAHGGAVCPLLNCSWSSTYSAQQPAAKDTAPVAV